MTNRALMVTTRLSLFCVAGRHFFGSALLMSNGFGVRLLHLHSRAVVEASMGVSRRGIKVDTSSPTARIILRNRGMSKCIHHATRSPEAEAVECRTWKKAEQLRGVSSVSNQLMVENGNPKAMDTGVVESGTERTTELQERQRSSSVKNKKSRNKKHSNVSKRQIVIPEEEWPR